MPAQADRPGPVPGKARTRRARAPSRPVEEILPDLEQERGRLVEAIDQLKAEARATRARLLSLRSLVIAGGALVALVVLRHGWKTRRQRRQGSWTSER